MSRSASDCYRALLSGQTRGPWPTLQRAGLSLATLPYGAAVAVRNRLYDGGWLRSHRVAVPVVSVGNLTVGGTGKTPCVEYVARHYRQQECCVAILSRGYGSTGGRNDEALVLEENLPDVPHLQGADRARLADIAVEELESEVLVLDDGFQHRRLARDLDVVLLDATNPWGHGRLLPRGLLREGCRGLRRAGVVVLTRCDQVSEPELARLHAEVARLAPRVPVIETTHRPVDLFNGDSAPLEHLRERPVAAFCGVGNPEAFRRTLLDLGSRLGAWRTFADHHPYSRADVADLSAWARQQPTDCLVVTTQKDWVKLRLTQLGSRDLRALRIQMHVVAGQEAFDQTLDGVFSVGEA